MLGRGPTSAVDAGIFQDGVGIHQFTIGIEAQSPGSTSITTHFAVGNIDPATVIGCITGSPRLGRDAKYNRGWLWGARQTGLLLVNENLMEA